MFTVPFLNSIPPKFFFFCNFLCHLFSSQKIEIHCSLIPFFWTNVCVFFYNMCLLSDTQWKEGVGIKLVFLPLTKKITGLFLWNLHVIPMNSFWVFLPLPTVEKQVKLIPHSWYEFKWGVNCPEHCVLLPYLFTALAHSAIIRRSKMKKINDWMFILSTSRKIILFSNKKSMQSVKINNNHNLIMIITIIIRIT